MVVPGFTHCNVPASYHPDEFLGGLLFLAQIPKGFQRILVFVMVIIGLGWMAGFEYTREIARKPYVVYGYMYSHGVVADSAEKINKEGFLKTAKWSQFKEVNDENVMQTGKELADMQCMACHTLRGHNDLVSRTNHLTEKGMEAKLSGLGHISEYMPPFLGTDKEKKALAAYIVRGLNNKEGKPQSSEFNAEKEKTVIPEFNEDSDYVLMAWNDLGMHCISDNSDYFSFLPPANTLWAQLIKRDPKPTVVSEGVKIKYEVEEGYKTTTTVATAAGL